MRALLRSPDPPLPRGEFATQPSAVAEGGLDAASWKQKVADAKQALDERNPDVAAARYTELYQDLAKTAGANVIADIPDSFPVHRANADDTGFKPGLNLVLKPGGSKGGTTAWVDSAGTFGVTLGLAPGDPEPHIAIRLFSSTFTDDKLMSLDILRHEMTHAQHHERTLTALRQWRKGGGKGSEGDFEKWLGAHRKGLSDADVELIKAEAKASKSSTETLAYVEGFMSVFHLIDPPPPPLHPVFVELLGVLSTSTVLPWANAPSIVHDEAIRRLEQYYCEVLDTGHRQAFDDWVGAQAKQATSDDAALKAKSNPGAVSTAKAHADEHFQDFIDRLQKIPAKCAARPAGAGSGHSVTATTGAETPADTAVRHVALLNGGRPGDEALVLSELRRLDKDTLTKVDEAAAKLPKNAGAALRRKISFARHTPADAVAGSDDLTITGGDTKVDAQAVDGGTVTVTSRSDLSWSETFPRTGKMSQALQNAVTFQYKGAHAQRSHWIQLISRQMVVTDAHGHQTVLDKATTNSSGISYRLTPKGSPPIIAVDRGTRSEPWDEHGSPSHRDSGSLNVADVPQPDDDLFKEYLTGADPAKNVRATAHLTTYLVRDDKVLFQVSTDVAWNWDRNTAGGSAAPPYQVSGPLYAVKGKLVKALDQRDREALVRDFPDMDYLP
jgi:hypothetical protein